MATQRVSFYAWPWIVLGILVVGGLLATFGLTQDPYAQDFLTRNQGPSAAHWLGTDQFDRDLLARIMAGAWLTLSVAAFATLAALAGGAGLALLACRVGGWFRSSVFTVFDLLRTLPAILVGLAIMTAAGAGTLTVILAIGLTFAPLFAYITSSAYDRERVAGYAIAARCDCSCTGHGSSSFSLRRARIGAGCAFAEAGHQFAHASAKCEGNDACLYWS